MEKAHLKILVFDSPYLSKRAGRSRTVARIYRKKTAQAKSIRVDGLKSDCGPCLRAIMIFLMGRFINPGTTRFTNERAGLGFLHSIW
jgi:hypothetical protein